MPEFRYTESTTGQVFIFQAADARYARLKLAAVRRAAKDDAIRSERRLVNAIDILVKQTGGWIEAQRGYGPDFRDTGARISFIYRFAKMAAPRTLGHQRERAEPIRFHAPIEAQDY